MLLFQIFRRNLKPGQRDKHVMLSICIYVSLHCLSVYPHLIKTVFIPDVHVFVSPFQHEHSVLI